MLPGRPLLSTATQDLRGGAWPSRDTPVRRACRGCCRAAAARRRCPPTQRPRRVQEPVLRDAARPSLELGGQGPPRLPELDREVLRRTPPAETGRPVRDLLPPASPSPRSPGSGSSRSRRARAATPQQDQCRQSSPSSPSLLETSGSRLLRSPPPVNHGQPAPTPTHPRVEERTYRMNRTDLAAFGVRGRLGQSPRSDRCQSIQAWSAYCPSTTSFVTILSAGGSPPVMGRWAPSLDRCPGRGAIALPRLCADGPRRLSPHSCPAPCPAKRS